jgi:hypothetical protein
MAKYNRPLGDILWIKFEGEALRTRSLPIYELGSSLIAIQRIIHKAALFSEGKLEKDFHLPTRRREELALQISNHEKGSDLWGLTPFLTDPALGPIFQQIIAGALIALAAYVGQKIGKKNETHQNQILIVNIFPDVKRLTDRIGNIGGVERIEFSGQQGKGGQGLIIDSRTQEYVREIEYQLVPGNKIIVSGVVTRLLPQSFQLDISDAPGHYIRVEMDGEQFEKIRRLPTLMEREIKFEGIPMYRLGETAGGIHTFRAHRIILSRNKSHE